MRIEELIAKPPPPWRVLTGEYRPLFRIHEGERTVEVVRVDLRRSSPASSRSSP